MLIEGTYKHLFGAGLQTLAKTIQQRVTETFSPWTVREKVAVEYAELVQLTMQVRRKIEEDMSVMINALFMPPEADWQETINANVKMHTQMQTAQASHTSSAHASSGLSLVNGGNSNQHTVDPTYMLLAQTWDVLESPLFAAVLTGDTSYLIPTLS